MLAAVLLRLKGYRIEARNWRCSLGEIDIVARRLDLVVFVEVKTRASLSAGAPEEAVDFRKQKRLVRLAQAYLQKRFCEPPPCRFDVIAVDTTGLFPRLRHFRGAFRVDGSA